MVTRIRSLALASALLAVPSSLSAPWLQPMPYGAPGPITVR
jgi:hypothetical protein